MTLMTRQRDAMSSRLLDTDPDVDWRSRAACRNRDPEMFHPNRSWSGRPPAEGDRTRVTAAKAICAGCPSVAACLAWAYEIGDDWAILGGTTPDERRAERVDEARIREHRCDWCQNPFWAVRARYCSKACRNRANRATRAGQQPIRERTAA